MQDSNPLLPGNGQTSQDDGYLLPRREGKVERPQAESSDSGTNAALGVIREKLARIYAEEPDPIRAQQKPAAVQPRSKHQQFMHDLNNSGKSLAEIQEAWHAYYAGLPDAEKHEVWREFYEANAQARQQQQPRYSASLYNTYAAARQNVRSLSQPLAQLSQRAIPLPPKTPAASQPVQPQPLAVQVPPDQRTPTDIRQAIRNKVSAGGKLRIRHHLQSLSFGLAMGFLTLVITMFGFFNEVIIAPFIQPSRTVSATPIIVDPSAVTTSSTPEVIIPKLNLEIPVDYSQTSDDENTIQNALQNGVVHYPSTVKPGENGNAAFFGHSSNSLFAPGKYKFAFVLLHELVPGDTFYLTYNAKTYIYKVFTTKIVDPTDIAVLNNIAGHPATATLITCDPPGTALRRLIVVGDQISPDPSTNGQGDNTSSVAAADTTIPDNGPSLFSRIWDSIF